MSKAQKLWLCVSQDGYELPEVIADSAKELAEICGTTPATISSQVSKFRHGKIEHCRWRCISLTEDEGVA